MAWKCIRCETNIFAPRKGAYAFVMKWVYSKKYKDLSVDIISLQKAKPKSIITHILCKNSQTDGFEERMKRAIKMPLISTHKLLV